MKILAASLALASFASAPHDHRGCSKLYTVRMDERAAQAIYAGSGEVTLKQLRFLGYMERCQRNRAAQALVRVYNRTRDRWHANRHAAAIAPKPAGRSSAGWSWPWSCIADHEGEPPGNPATDTGNGFFGGLQFTMQTWLTHGGSGNPAAASIVEQEAVAESVLRDQGWGAWPRSSVACGL